MLREPPTGVVPPPHIQRVLYRLVGQRRNALLRPDVGERCYLENSCHGLQESRVLESFVMLGEASARAQVHSSSAVGSEYRVRGSFFNLRRPLRTGSLGA